jgi:hypothetical protein
MTGECILLEFVEAAGLARPTKRARFHNWHWKAQDAIVEACRRADARMRQGRRQMQDLTAKLLRPAPVASATCATCGHQLEWREGCPKPVLHDCRNPVAVLS